MGSPSSPAINWLPLAQSDLAAIIRYTEHRFGSDQAMHYAGIIDDILIECLSGSLVAKPLADLLTDPAASRRARRLNAGYLRSPSRLKHTIVITWDGLNLIVLRILHNQMNLDQHRLL